MFNHDKNSVSIRKFAEKMLNGFEKKNYKKVADVINNPFSFYLSYEHALSSKFARSFDSSFGTNMQSTAVDIAKNQGFNIINDGKNDNDIMIEGTYSDETRKIINDVMTYIENSNAKNPISDDIINSYMIKILDCVLLTKGEKKKVNADLILFKNGVIDIIELKAGGDLDKGKSKQQKEDILVIYAVLISKYKEEIRNSKLKVNIRFGTFYNKNKMEKGVNEWVQSSVKKNFLCDELLIGGDFWAYLCDDVNAYSKILKIYSDHISILQKCIKTYNLKTLDEIIDKVEKIDNENIKDSLNSTLYNKFVFNDKQLELIIRSGKYNSIFIHLDSICFYTDVDKKTLDFTSNFNFHNAICFFDKEKNVYKVHNNVYSIRP